MKKIARTVMGILISVTTMGLALDIVKWAATDQMGDSAWKLIDRLVDKVVDIPFMIVDKAIHLVFKVLESIVKMVVSMIAGQRAASSISFT